MNFEHSRTMFTVVAIAVWSVVTAIIATFVYFMIWRPDIVPATQTYWSYWIGNLSLLVALLAFAASATASTFNAMEQRSLRYMENYPFLEIFPLHSVDTLPLPIPRLDILPALESFNTDYLRAVAPSQPVPSSDTDIRFLAMAMRNVGHGIVTNATIEGTATVPGRAYPTIPFTIKRQFNLPPGETSVFTLIPIAGLPEYRVCITRLEYHGHFAKLTDFDGRKEFSDVHPYAVPAERKVTLLLDHFQDIPAGQGWILDFWGAWRPTDYCFVPLPNLDDHFLMLRGDKPTFISIPHFNGKGGAYRDLSDTIPYGSTVKVTATVRSSPGTDASICIWCHDIAPNPKNRYSACITPSTSWQDISMLYTATATRHLRVHLLYSPGLGEIHVDKLLVEGLYT